MEYQMDPADVGTLFKRYLVLRMQKRNWFPESCEFRFNSVQFYLPCRRGGRELETVKRYTDLRSRTVGAMEAVTLTTVRVLEASLSVEVTKFTREHVPLPWSFEQQYGPPYPTDKVKPFRGEDRFSL
ncbi:hypothetical protein AAG570_001359 [Ranatra chinensis]|uniref:Uncharacterized protein n=1 Tax=Ranatra chinensis TaxID=642074 RepID=A0ABD0YBN7_9HEMI